CPSKPKYNPLQNESLSLLEIIAGRGGFRVYPLEELPSSSTSSLGPILPPWPGDDSPTTLCSFFPQMSSLKLASLAGGPEPKGEPGRAAENGEEIVGTAVPDSGSLPLLQDMNKMSIGSGHRTWVEGGQLGGEEWTCHGSFVNKPTQGWLHPNNVTGPGVSYLVWYMEVLQLMRAFDFNTQTQVTREAIGLVCEAVAGAKGTTRRRKSLNLMATDCKQIIAKHHMQSISFAFRGDPDTAKYVAHVAKDPVNQRACHILECPEGLAQDIISTTGQAFEFRFKQYLRNPPKLVTSHDRMAGFDGSAWDEEEEEPPDHQYYNDFPGKEPPLGGVVDMRLRERAAPGVAGPTPLTAQTPSHLGATPPIGRDPEARKQLPPPLPCPGRLFHDPSYVNIQNLDKARQAGDGAGPRNSAISGSASRDLFDMKPFKDPFRVAPLAQSVSMAEQLQGEPWCHGKLSRGEQVQESTTTPGQYMLTGLQSGQPKRLPL
uniref:PID domain-containing protein n=1 Tax=Otolemur garnettii TaxID=30611 RepID=H0XJC1_OTOGA